MKKSLIFLSLVAVFLSSTSLSLAKLDFPPIDGLDPHPGIPFAQSKATISLYNLINSSYKPGVKNVPVYAFTVNNDGAEDLILAGIQLQGMVDGNLSGSFSYGFSEDDGYTPLVNLVAPMKLYDVDSKEEVMYFKYVVGLSGTVITNLAAKKDYGLPTIIIPKNTKKTFILRANINYGGPYGVVPDRVKFGIMHPVDVTLVGKQSLKNISPTLNNTQNGGLNDGGVFMTIKK